MSRVRVHELAKELGVDSKTVLAKLEDLGEFVKSASSTVEAPVQRRLREAIPPAPEKPAKPADSETPAKSAKAAKPAKKAAASSDAEPELTASAGSQTADAAAAKPATKPGPKPGQATKPAESAESSKPAKPAEPAEPAEPEAAAAAEPDTSAAAAATESAPPAAGPAATESEAAKSGPAAEAPAPKPAAPKPAAPKPGPKPASPKPRARQGNNPYASSQGMPRSGDSRSGGPRPGNNPFATSQGMPRPGSRPGPRPGGSDSGEGQANTGGAAARPAPSGPGGQRPTPGMMPGRASVPRPGAPSGGPGGGPGGGRGRGRSGGTGGSGPGAGRPGGGFPGRGRGGRGSTQGAFGRSGGRPAKGRKSKRAKRQEFERQGAPSVGGVQVPRGDGETELRIRAGASLVDFAERIDANPASLVTVLFHLGEMATATQSLDEDTFQTLGAELGYVIKIVSPEEEDKELLGSFDIDLAAEEASETEADQEPRSPVVTVMGHVDHGKTATLDAIRQTDSSTREAGGITQHIGAYQIRTDHEDHDRAITFIDTPGHEAFTAMRARGAQVTDIAILVVAADDGVMPQTVEALNHAQSANVPIVVAVNKVDKPEANPDKLRAQLTEYNLVAEEYGGETMFVDVSAKQRTGIDELLEAVLLTADAALELRANPDKDARGVAIEANLDKGRGAVATVLVKSGTLEVGDAIVAGTAHGRVRAMFDEHGESVTQAGPAQPVQVIGLTSVPRAGDTFLVSPDDRTARQIADKREAAERAATLAKRRKRVSLEDFTEHLESGKVETLNLVIKGDVSGAVEALEDALLKVDVGAEVQLRIIHRGVGAITQNDVNLATVDDAVILGFNVRTAERVADLADREGVEIKYYSVIYQAIEEIEHALKGMLKPEYEEAQLGTAEIRQVFRSSKVGSIAGSMVRSGTIRRGTKARLLRDGVVVVDNLSVSSLRREKDDVTEVRDGFECGIGLGYREIAEGDVIETFEMREIPRT